MYRALLILPAILLFLFLCWGLFYYSYVKVDREILEEFKRKNHESLRGFVLDRNLNWYQRSAAMERYCALTCLPEDVFLGQVLRESDTSLRRAALEGCYLSPGENVDWLIPIALKDAYSYNRYQTLVFLRDYSRRSEFYSLVVPLGEDSSSMVSNEAKDFLAEHGQLGTSERRAKEK